MFICAKLRDLGIEGLKDKINKLKEIEFLKGWRPITISFSHLSVLQKNSAQYNRPTGNEKFKNPSCLKRTQKGLGFDC
jgi:hypothetical protein